MKILVLAANYTKPQGPVSLHYIHSRNTVYVEMGIEVVVLSFAADSCYVIDGVKVITFQSYKSDFSHVTFDALVLHAPNLKNHYRFLLSYGNKFKRLFFFFHGHEVLKISEIYPPPYDYLGGNSFARRLVSRIYDVFKLALWRRYFERVAERSDFVFVSQWMLDMFIKYVGLNEVALEGRTHIIPNCVGRVFETQHYDVSSDKKYDFITIRNNLDGSKYCIDIVCRIAENNPEYRFCVVGKGSFFKYNRIPDNLVWIEKNLSHEEIIRFLNLSRCALLPTRVDAQGVMACEMATFGIPLITSNLEVCRQVFDGFENVEFIDNEAVFVDIRPLLSNIILHDQSGLRKNKTYCLENTLLREIGLFRRRLEQASH